MTRERRSPPPPEAYSRVTNPERFLPLHHRADALLRRLEEEYFVVREEDTALRAPPEGVTLARASVGLRPRHAAAAPILISYTSFPGILLYFGRGSKVVLPPCGCDACGSTGEREASAMIQIVENVVAGRFEEQLQPPDFAWRVWSDRGSRGRGNISLEGWEAAVTRWEPWPKRSSTSPA
jgi:hypothetical protein